MPAHRTFTILSMPTVLDARVLNGQGVPRRRRPASDVVRQRTGRDPRRQGTGTADRQAPGRLLVAAHQHLPVRPPGRTTSAEQQAAP